MVLSEIVAWALTPLSGAGRHAPAGWVAWHGRLMVLGWSVMLPVGMFAARFFKIHRERDWPAVLDRKPWWRTHVWLQCAGIGVMSTGVAVAFVQAHGVSVAARAHHLLGWTVFGIGWLQVAGGVLRGSKGGPTAAAMRGDHYDMTLRRRVFEIVHKSAGWVALPLVVAGTALGLVLADAPRWMAVVLALWWSGLAVIFVGLQRAGRCVDTYQAIWGPDAMHPGNGRSPIGVGVRRFSEARALPWTRQGASPLDPPDGARKRAETEGG